MLNSNTSESKMSNEDIEKFIRPIVSVVAYEANHTENRSNTMTRLEIVRANARTILEKAKVTYIAEGGAGNNTIFDILEGAFTSNNSGWSLVGDQSLIVKEFINRIIANIQKGEQMTYSNPANESQIKITA